MDVTATLFELRDEKYADFQAKLTPTIDRELFIGVRVPKVKELAKSMVKDGSYKDFINDLPHKYYDENMLHSCILTIAKDTSFDSVEAFLPYVDNWAVCDTLKPNVFKKMKPELLEHIDKWVKDDKVYTIRFGIEMLMNFFLDKDFEKDYLSIPLITKNGDYYVRMMLAWFYATALAKKWDETIVILEEKKLDVWTHNKTIQKSKESFRITDEQKEYLNTLKIKGTK